MLSVKGSEVIHTLMSTVCVKHLDSLTSFSSGLQNIQKPGRESPETRSQQHGMWIIKQAVPSRAFF